MENKGFNREEAEKQLNEWKERINQLKANIQNAKDDIKVDVLGDLEKMENHEAEIRNKMVKLNEGREKWEDIESSIGEALYKLKSSYDKTNSRYNL
jgi:chromosome segregation ATPase